MKTVPYATDEDLRKNWVVVAYRSDADRMRLLIGSHSASFSRPERPDVVVSNADYILSIADVDPNAEKLAFNVIDRHTTGAVSSPADLDAGIAAKEQQVAQWWRYACDSLGAKTYFSVKAHEDKELQSYNDSKCCHARPNELKFRRPKR